MTESGPLDVAAVQRASRVGRLAARDSLRFRLSLLVTLLVAVVLSIFLWASNRALRQTTLQAGGERALAASIQVASVLGQNTSRGLREIGRLATDPLLLEYIERPNDELRARVEARIRPLAAAGNPPVALLSATGAHVLQVPGPESSSVTPATSPAAAGMPTHVGIGELQRAGNEIFSDIVAEIPSGGGDSSNIEEPARTAGFLVIRRVIRPGPNVGTASRLIGAGAMVAIGNRSGGLWTDLSHVVPAPSIDTTQSGLTSYTTAGGETRTGGLAVIDSTPWAVWIDLPERLVLAPARMALRRMLWLAMASVVLAIVAGIWLSAHIVRPLDELTHASEAIAAGALDARVKTGRRDEIGRLARAFNVMSDHVAEAHRELEARVQRRTARLEEARGMLNHRVEELQEARSELEARAGELSALNRELESFSYSVSHDLRAPLRHIHGFVGLLKQSAPEKLSPEEARWLQTIADASSRMGQLIDDLLEFSKTSRAALTRLPVDLNQLVDGVRQELASDPGNGRAAWTIGELPHVIGDSALLHQVFVNLLSNALKYTRRADAPAITVAARAEGDDGLAVIYVRDNGVGFDMKYAAKLFGVFQRLHDDEQFEGTGIGLANVQRIVHRHGGRAWAESTLNGGATFFISLPKAETIDS